VRLLDRYVIWEFSVRVVTFLTILVSLFIGIELISKVWQINSSFSTLIMYYLLRVPDIMLKMLPVSILLSTLLFFSYLSKYNELIALYTSGRSLIRIAMPMFAVVLFLSAGSFYMYDNVLPLTNFKAQKIWMVDILGRGGEFIGSLYHEKAWFRGNGFIYNVGSYDSSTRTINDINIYYFNNQFDLIQHVFAPVADYDNGYWSLKNGKVTLFDGAHPVTSSFEKKMAVLGEKPEEFKKVEAISDYLKIKKLAVYIQGLKEIGVDPSKYEVEYHKRFSLSMVGFIMSFIALPFAVKQHRSGGVSFNIGISFVLVFLYWILFSLMLSFGLSGHLSPVLSAWGSNIIFFVTAVFLTLRTKK
jgi:lipopolysaccharide export system permease protein